MVPIWQIQRDARNYPKPKEFIPERWVRRSNGDGSEWIGRKPGDETPAGIAAGSTDAFLAFSAGGRNCVGQKLAKAETCIIFAEILRHLKFELKPGYELNSVRSGAIQKPKGGMPMTVRTRI
jgi:cytochrome P450